MGTLCGVEYQGSPRRCRHEAFDTINQIMHPDINRKLGGGVVSTTGCKAQRMYCSSTLCINTHFWSYFCIDLCCEVVFIVVASRTLYFLFLL